MLQGRHKEALDEDDAKDQNHRTEVKPAHRRQPAADFIQHRIRCLNQKSDNGIVRISIDPRNDRSGDDNPDVGIRDQINQLGKGEQEISKNEHERLQLVWSGARPLC